ncbi:MAG TPA: sulfotransferase [Allosphingosinicella sp.]|nr:sulfotransferase [Allosphingosinicella sp.]
MSEAPETLLRRANLLLNGGDVGEAIDAHERLLAAKPDLPDSWFNLAWLQRRARRYEDALGSYDEALRRRVGRPEEVRLNRAVILSEHLKRPEAAEAELREAVRLNPSFLGAWLNLGMLQEDRGDVEQARGAYEKALELLPGNGRALARLAALDVFSGAAEAAVARLRPLLGGSGLAPDDAIEIAFALGDAFDALGRYDEAFQAYSAANLMSRRHAPPASRYDARAQERLIDELIRAFPSPAPARGNSEIKPPIFICGMFRSGSTLAEQIVSRHSEVTAGGELEILPALVGQHLQPYPQKAASAPPDLIDEVRAAYLREIALLHPDARVLTDKRVDNFLHIGLIKTLFPNARIVHTKRHPFDNILSIYFLYFQYGITYGFDLGEAAHWYGQYLRLMDHWKSLYPEDIHDFDYDEVVSDPREAVASLLHFCGLAWEEACLSPESARNAVRTASLWQVRQPLHTRSSGRWRNYEEHLGPVKDALGL